MPIIIWGSRGLTSRVDSGRFYCPQCDQDRQYDLKQVRPFFTLYWIPLFPIGGAQRYIECRSCGGGFTEDVLELRPPTDGERLAAQIYDDLHGGTSLEEAQDKLIAMGMQREQARNIVGDVAGADTWSCGGCNQNYVKSVKKCRSCKSA